MPLARPQGTKSPYSTNLKGGKGIKQVQTRCIHEVSRATLLGHIPPLFEKQFYCPPPPAPHSPKINGQNDALPPPPPGLIKGC